MNPMVQVKNVTRTYQSLGEPVHALKGINLEVSTGVLVALKGRSGSGKTTLLNIIAGLDQPSSGEIIIDGKPIHTLNDEALSEFRYRHLGLIFQSFALLPTYSAFENVEFMLRLSGIVGKTAQSRTAWCLKAVGLGNRMHHRPDELSGGQQQRLAVARALANRPLLILADEPTGELDTDTTKQILTLFRRLVEQEGITMLVTSHDPLVDEVADQIYELRDGEVFLKN